MRKYVGPLGLVVAMVINATVPVCLLSLLSLIEVVTSAPRRYRCNHVTDATLNNLTSSFHELEP